MSRVLQRKGIVTYKVYHVNEQVLTLRVDGYGNYIYAYGVVAAKLNARYQIGDYAEIPTVLYEGSRCVAV